MSAGGAAGARRAAKRAARSGGSAFELIGPRMAGEVGKWRTTRSVLTVESDEGDCERKA